MIPDSLPTLSVGSHGAGTGSMCVMNALSYLKGDKSITDFPDCTDPFLARVAQILNDQVCTHQVTRTLKHDQVSELCGKCSHDVWLFGSKLMGTAEPWRIPGSHSVQWGVYRDVVIGELERFASPVWFATRELRGVTKKVIELLRKPYDVGLSLNTGEALSVCRATGSPLPALEVLDKAIQLARTANTMDNPDIWTSFSAGELVGPKDRAIHQLAIDAAYVALICSGWHRPRFNGKVLSVWAHRILGSWEKWAGYPLEPLTLSAPQVEKLRADAGLIRV